MSAPCRSSKARLPAALGPDAPGHASNLRPAFSRRAASAPSHSNRRRPLTGSRPKATVDRSTTLTLRKRLENAGTAPGQWPGPSHSDKPGSASAGGSLFNFDLRSSLFQGSLDLLSFFLGYAFLDRLRRSFDQVFRFLQAERGYGAHFLDHFDLLVADRREDDAKLSLLFDRSGGSASGRSSGDSHRSGGRDAPLAFKQLGELSGFQNCEAREFVDDFFEIGH